jgi:hypothetical protein
MGVAAFAMEERSTEFVLQLLDGARQRGLADIALLRGSREIERAGQRHKISDLLHFHRQPPNNPLMLAITP